MKAQNHEKESKFKNIDCVKKTNSKHFGLKIKIAA